MILSASPAVTVLKRNGLRIACLRLRYELRRVFENLITGGFELFVAGQIAVAAEDDPLAIEVADREVFQIVENHLTLVDIAQPEGGKGGQKRALGEVVADDLGREGEERAVVGELRADGIHDRDALFSDAMNEARHADHRVAAECHGVEPAVGEAGVDDIHLAQAGDGFQVDLVIENKEVAALHEGDAHAAAEEAVLRVSGTERAGSEEHDHRVGVVRMRAEHFHDSGRDIRDRVDAGVLERLRNHAGEGAAVLHHVGNARRVAEVVVLHGEFAAG